MSCVVAAAMTLKDLERVTRNQQSEIYLAVRLFVLNVLDLPNTATNAGLDKVMNKITSEISTLSF